MSAVLPLARSRPAAISLAWCCVAAAGLLGYVSFRSNVERACTAGDTPYLDFCGDAPAGRAPAEKLRERIVRNPGDANAYVELALQDAGAAHGSLVDLASRLAPHEPNLLLRRAAAALERNDVAAAIPPLVELAEHRDDPRASRAIAGLLAMGHAQLFVPLLTPGSHWIHAVLAQVRQDRRSFAGALPLVAEALSRRLLQPAEIRTYLRELKAVNAWGDAYGLWLALHGNQPLPALFNPSFDLPLEEDGFDWEAPTQGPPGKAGVIVERRRSDARTGQLDARFTGKAISLPIVRQYLFLGSGRYRLQGEYQARPLRTEEGLAWSVRCGRDIAGRSVGLTDTGGEWRRFAFEFTLPPDCGLVASLELETHASTEAALGLRGRISFDAFKLEKLAF